MKKSPAPLFKVAPHMAQVSTSLLWIAFAGYMCVLPIGGTVALRNLFFAVMLLCFALLNWGQWRRLDFLLWKIWLVYGSVILASLFYAIDITYSLGEIKVEFLYPLLLFWFGLNFIRDDNSYFRLIVIAASSNVFLVSYSLAVTAIGETTKDGLVGTLNTGVGTYSTYLITIMPLVALFTWRNWMSRQAMLSGAMLLLLLAGLASLYFTLNRQGLLVLIVEIGIVAAFSAFKDFSWARTVVLLAALALTLLMLFQASTNRAPAPEPNSEVSMTSVSQSVKSDVRWHLWKFSLQKIGESPLTGGGFGQRVFKLRFPDFEPNSMLWHAHNTVLNKGIQMGIPGMLAFLLLFFSVPWSLRMGLRANSSSRQIASVGIAIALGVFLKNMTDDFFTRECGYLYWIIIGATLGCIRGQIMNNKESV